MPRPCTKERERTESEDEEDPDDYYKKKNTPMPKIFFNWSRPVDYQYEVDACKDALVKFAAAEAGELPRKHLEKVVRSVYGPAAQVFGDAQEDVLHSAGKALNPIESLKHNFF